MTVRKVLGVLAIIGVIGLFLFCFVVVPDLFVTTSKLTKVEWLKARSDVRSTAIQALGGLAVIAGAFLTAAMALRTIQQTREGQITDRFSHAIDQ